MFMDQERLNFLQIDLQNQYNLNSNPSRLFCKNGENDLKICMEKQRAYISHSDTGTQRVRRTSEDAHP